MLFYFQPLCPAQEKNPLSLQGAFDVLTSTFNHPTEGRVCARRLHVAVSRIQEDLLPMSLPKKIKFAKSHPRFARASIRFLTRKLSPEEFHDLTAHLLLCTCDCFNEPGMHALHMPDHHWFLPNGKASPADYSALTQALWLGITFMQATLTAMTTHKFRRHDPTIQDPDSQPWPLGPDDLLPFGIQDSINALNQWGPSLIGGYEIWGLAIDLLKFYKPFAVAITAPQNYEFGFSNPLIHLATVLHVYEKQPEMYEKGAGTVEDAIDEIFAFFSALALSGVPGFESGLRRASPLLNPIVDIVSRLLPTLSFADPRRRRQVGTVLESLRATANGLNCSPKALRDRDFIGPAFATIAGVGRGGCGCITCPSTNSTSAATRCGGCNVVRYCRKECQRSDWRSPTVPHKVVCLLIQQLKSELGDDVWAKLWSPGFEGRQAETILKKNKVDVRKLVSVSDMLNMSLRQKIAFREREQMMETGEGGSELWEQGTTLPPSS